MMKTLEERKKKGGKKKREREKKEKERERDQKMREEVNQNCALNPTVASFEDSNLTDTRCSIIHVSQ